MEKCRFTEEQIKEASEVNILSLVALRGMDVKKMSRREYKIPGYGGLIVRADGLKWNWFSQNKGGTAIQFIMEFDNLSWVDSIKKLLDSDYEDVKYIPPPKIDFSKKEELILPKKNSTYKHIFAYLIKTRKLDADIVKQFVTEKKIYEDERKNCVFVSYDEDNNPKYASMRGTNPNRQFRGDIEGSSKEYPFSKNGMSDTLLIFESQIDLMSFMTLLKIFKVDETNDHLIAMGSLNYVSVDGYLERNSNIKNLILCVDNDKYADKYCIDFAEKYQGEYKIQRQTPKTKDFNEDLVKLVEHREKSIIEKEKDNDELEL